MVDLRLEGEGRGLERVLLGQGEGECEDTALGARLVSPSCRAEDQAARVKVVQTS